MQISSRDLKKLCPAQNRSGLCRWYRCLQDCSGPRHCFSTLNFSQIAVDPLRKNHSWNHWQTVIPLNPPTSSSFFRCAKHWQWCHLSHAFLNVQYEDLLPVRFPRECWWILHIENCRDLGSNISVFIWCNVDKYLYKDPWLSCCGNGLKPQYGPLTRPKMG